MNVKNESFLIFEIEESILDNLYLRHTQEAMMWFSKEHNFFFFFGRFVKIKSKQYTLSD